MKKTGSARRGSEARRPAGAPLWRGGLRPALVFAAKLAGVAGGLYALSQVPWSRPWVSSYLGAIARSADFLLHCFGQKSSVAAGSVFLERHALNVAPECSAFETMSFLSATIVCIPGSWLWKSGGILAGLCFVAALNAVRIATLLVIRVRWPAFFETLHQDLWPLLLIVGAVGFLAVWSNIGQGRRGGADHAGA